MRMSRPISKVDRYLINIRRRKHIFYSDIILEPISKNEIQEAPEFGISESIRNIEHGINGHEIHS